MTDLKSMSHKDLEEYAIMGDECLGMVKEEIVRHGLDMTGSPPMFYDYAIHTLWARTVRAASWCEREHRSHEGDDAQWGQCVIARIRSMNPPVEKT